MTFSVRPLNSWVCEVDGLDCGRESEVAEAATELRLKFAKFHIIVYRGQFLTPNQLASFSELFGELEVPRNFRYSHPERQHVMVLSNQIRSDGSAVGVVDAGTDWHSDSSHEVSPAMATFLQSVRNPTTGGDTVFCNLQDAYDALDDEIKNRIDGRMAVHAGSKLVNKRTTISARRPGALEDYQKTLERGSVRQPLVRTHPVTGRRSLYASPRFTIDVEGETDADALLDMIFQHLEDTRFHYRHHWLDGDLVMWDNRCLNHRATGGIPDGDIRRMYRTVVAGNAAFFDPSQPTVVAPA